MRHRWITISAFLFGSELKDALDDGRVFMVQAMRVIGKVGLVQFNIFLCNIIDLPFVYLFIYKSNSNDLFFDEI
jgi:hypothetical protein